MNAIIKNIIAYVHQPQFIKTLGCIVFIMVAMLPSLHAQVSDPSIVDPDAVPIDGGISLLVAAGVGYGAKKMKEKRKQAAK